MTAAPARAAVAAAKPSRGMLLQRKCACGSPVSAFAGECTDCKSKRRLQAKLSIGPRSDPFEQEADRVADQVLAMPTPAADGGAGLHVQRFAGAVVDPTNPAPDSVDRALASSGRPLDAALRGDMERRFGHDFSRVRVHDDTVAAASAHAVGARAYTVGDDIAFAHGEFAPSTREGRHLLAHELAHTLQQAGGAPAVPQAKMGPPSPDEEFKCPAPVGQPTHPETVSKRLIDGWKGLRAKEGEQGEGCSDKPYVAGRGETVCTMGYGDQIEGCPVINASTGQAPTDAERNDKNVALGCACVGQKSTDCKGTEAERQLLQNARAGINWVHDNVPVDLDQAKFDALVDLTLHSGSIPRSLLTTIRDNYCSPGGWDVIRDQYLQTNLTRQRSKKIEPGFVSRRKHRVWPPSP